MQSISQTNRQGHGEIPYCYVENNKYIHSRTLWADIFFLFAGIFLNSFSHPELRVLYYSILHHLPGPVFTWTCEQQLVVEQKTKNKQKKTAGTLLCSSRFFCHYHYVSCVFGSFGGFYFEVSSGRQWPHGLDSNHWCALAHNSASWRGLVVSWASQRCCSFIDCADSAHFALGMGDMD